MIRTPLTRITRISKTFSICFTRLSIPQSHHTTPIYRRWNTTNTSTSTSTSTSTPTSTTPKSPSSTSTSINPAIQEAIDASHHSTNNEIKVHPRAEHQPQVEISKMENGTTTSTSSYTQQTKNMIRSVPSLDTMDSYTFPHPIWSKEYANGGVQVTHREPVDAVEKAAYYAIQLIRFNFDWISGFSLFKHTPTIWLNRVCFLETIAGIPGSIGGTLRHLASLRRMRRDHGWIHTLMEEAENERMHLLTFITLKKPGPLFRAAVFVSQGVFFNFFWIMYLISPRFCHRLVGYLEEEATKTYTKMLQEIDDPKSLVAHYGHEKAPKIAKVYWKLDEDATIRDVIAQIRADESHHRDVNHTFADLVSTQASPNPFRPGH